MGNFEIVDHTADWALRVFGPDLAGLLLQAALGTSCLLVDELSAVPMDTEREIIVESIDAEGLLVDWLTELAYFAETEQLVFRDFEFLEVTQTRLKAVARGGRASQLQKHIKAVTFHNLEIIAVKGGLEATVVFDV